MSPSPRIVVLTGAGLSAESGLSTFRDPTGLWSRYNWRDVATPEGFARDPGGVHAFYNMRRAVVLAARPNAGHLAIARLERDWPGEVLVITQNVDDLHEKAGSRNLIHMHGQHAGALCAGCGHRWPAPPVMLASDPCPACGRPSIRPDVVWFGEIPYEMERIHAAISGCNMFVSVGTSGTVQPAGGLVRRANAVGARTVELNLEPSAGAHLFDEACHGPATEIVPAWVDRVLGAPGQERAPVG